MACARQFAAAPVRPALARPSRRLATCPPAGRPRATPPTPSSSSSPPPPPPPPPPAADSDPVFLAKLLAISFSGAAAVKYGSLFLETPFHPDLGLAAAFVVLPTLAYWGVLAVEAGLTVKGGPGEQ